MQNTRRGTPADAECALCNDRLHTGFLGRQPVWGCLWCQAFAHAPCVASLTGSRSSLKGGLCNCGGAHACASRPHTHTVPHEPSHGRQRIDLARIQIDMRLVADGFLLGVRCLSPQESDRSAHVHRRESASDGRDPRQQQCKGEPGQDADGRQRKLGTA